MVPLFGCGHYELGRGQLAEGTVRPNVVVFVPPSFDGNAGSVDRGEPVKIEVVISKDTVETLDKCVLLWLAGLNEVELDVAAVGPGVECPTGKL